MGESARRGSVVSMPEAHRGHSDSSIHRQPVPNTRGSVLTLCPRSRQDPANPPNPRLPVLECAGHEPRPELRQEGR